MRPFRPVLRPGALAAGLVLLLATPAGAQSDILLQLESGSPASGRFVVDSAGGFVARGTYNRGSIPATGEGVRLMWYPRNAAFRVGRVSGSQWDEANVGIYSLATGYNTTASGQFSTAIGLNTTASGNYTTAMGSNTTASGTWSTAMGDYTTASGNRSTAMGYSTTAIGTSATAMGFATIASGVASTAMGQGTRASGQSSTAMGRRAVSGHTGSFVYGDLSGTDTDTVRSSAINQATWRTTGGFRIFTNMGLTTWCLIEAGGSAWSCTSSRLEKENVAEVDGEDVLRRLRSVPVTSWNGIAEGPQVRHIGPMAQDWHAAFGLNDDPLTIHQGDLAGVSLAAVQALDERTRNVPGLEREVALLREENGGLREEVAQLRTEAAARDAETAVQRARLERLEGLVAGLVIEP
jgi:trimeric autotransporter adhesin